LDRAVAVAVISLLCQLLPQTKHACFAVGWGNVCPSHSFYVMQPLSQALSDVITPRHQADLSRLRSEVDAAHQKAAADVAAARQEAAEQVAAADTRARK
jgi:hypothetical protein